MIDAFKTITEVSVQYVVYLDLVATCVILMGLDCVWETFAVVLALCAKLIIMEVAVTRFVYHQTTPSYAIVMESWWISVSLLLCGILAHGN